MAEGGECSRALLRLQLLAEEFERSRSVRAMTGAEGRRSSGLGLPSVLIVEDDRDILEATWQSLQEEFVVFGAADIAEALAIASNVKVSVLLIDLHLGSKGGRELIEQYRAAGGSGKIILYSADRDLRRIAREIHVDGFLEKPFDLDALLRMLRTLTR